MFIYSPFNSTTNTSPSLLSTVIIYTIYSLAFVIVLTISLIIFYLTYTHSKLKTVSNLLICNTCFVSLFYSITTFLQVFMVVFNSYHPFGGDTRVFCIARLYLSTVASALLSFSLLLQALSRLFYTVFYEHRNCLLTWNFHYLLIGVQWLIGFLIPISILIRSGDVLFRPTNFCTVGLDHKLHLYYLYSSSFIVPVVCIFPIYITIFYRVKYSRTRANQHQTQRRELRILHNILVLGAIFTFGGLPSVIYICLMVPRRILSIHFFIFTILSIPLAVAMEKVSVLCMNTEFRTAFVSCCCRTRRNRRRRRRCRQRRRQ